MGVCITGIVRNSVIVVHKMLHQKYNQWYRRFYSFDDSDLVSPVLRDDLEESVGSKCEAGQSSEEYSKR